MVLQGFKHQQYQQRCLQFDRSTSVTFASPTGRHALLDAVQLPKPRLHYQYRPLLLRPCATTAAGGPVYGGRAVFTQAVAISEDQLGIASLLRTTQVLQRCCYKLGQAVTCMCETGRVLPSRRTGPCDAAECIHGKQIIVMALDRRFKAASAAHASHHRAFPYVVAGRISAGCHTGL